MLPATAVVNGALQDRANYEGSWAVAIPGASCPAEAPVLCDTDSITTTGCCPSGDTCFGLGGTYCCPTKSDCSTTVTNFPSCFNETWTLYAAKTTADYFCCPPGQYGVLPLSDYGGICQYDDVAVDSSRSATLVEQLGTRSASPTTRTATITSTRNDGVETTITEVVTGKTTATGEASPAGTGGSAQVPSGNDNDSGSSSGSTSSSSNKGLSAGAIAGIVIGSLGVLALFLVAFMLYRRNSKRSNAQPGGAGGTTGGTVEGYGGGMQQQAASAPSYSAVPQRQDNYPIPVENKSPAMQTASPAPTGFAQTQYGNELPHSPAISPHGPYEAHVPPTWEGRAEMGSSRG